MNYPVCGKIYFRFPHVEVLPYICIFVQIDEKWLLIHWIICKLGTFPCTVPFSILENVAELRNFSEPLWILIPFFLEETLRTPNDIAAILFTFTWISWYLDNKWSECIGLNKSSMITGRVKLRYTEKDLQLCHFSTSNPTSTALGLTLVLLDKNLLTTWIMANIGTMVTVKWLLCIDSFTDWLSGVRYRLASFVFMSHVSPLEIISGLPSTFSKGFRRYCSLM